MIPAVARRGNSFKGAVGYITHDPGKSSAERVVCTGVLNMRTNDPEKAAKVMAWTTLHAAELKEAAGFKRTGRKTEGPVYHFALTWEHGNQPDEAHMAETAKSALLALGYQEHEAVYAAHTDKDHWHVHVVVNRINPVTGKAHNPDNDKNILQRWAYQYEKAQGNVICLDRAIKYEKDPALRAEYQRRLTQEIEAGKGKESKPRPQWEAEKDAPFPKSKDYQQLKAEFAERVREIAKNGRDTAQRQARELADLKARHQAERAALKEKQHQAFGHRRAFGQAAKLKPYSWGAYQADRNALRKEHAEQLQALRTNIKERDAPAVKVFDQGQKAAWREFYKLDKAATRGQFEAVLKLVTSTPVSKQGPDYRDHLARLFQRHATLSERKAAFAVTLKQQRREVMAGLTAAKAPALAALKAKQKTELVALRQRFDTAKTVHKTRAQTVVRARAESQHDRRDLLTRQRTEASALKAKNAEETRAQQKTWGQLNKDRSEAWSDYKARRAKQMEARKTKDRSDPSTDRDQAQSGHDQQRGTLDSYAASRAVKSSDTGRGRESGQDNSRDAGPSITRKGPR